MSSSDQEAGTAVDPPKTGSAADAPEDASALEPATATASGSPEAGDRQGMTPRQARRLRITVASALMVLAAVVLAVRLASRSSVLVVGVYGLLLVLCGLVIELSRRGRTRLGTYLLGAGLVGALLGDWVLLP
ncbi:hypothetical protein H9Y04_14260 [Streptomyces sp. TRM66268-LWL]|uniref:Uncharacterized protein n=1 Tax=Streptomyces polyasparticus TaxID=2767826 RepID=A0ABR7SE10_9ACTN|nr:hypothetical protein [Streptomyces polyasparticus]MBC9713731.1 hypothetical protein [Streptomyces polyasparticus]